MRQMENGLRHSISKNLQLPFLLPQAKNMKLKCCLLKLFLFLMMNDLFSLMLMEDNGNATCRIISVHRWWVERHQKKIIFELTELKSFLLTDPNQLLLKITICG